jgi:predicted HicB family RNase H-like nuclease
MSKPLGKRVAVTVRLPKFLAARLSLLAKKERIPLNTLMLRCLAPDKAPDKAAE